MTTSTIPTTCRKYNHCRFWQIFDDTSANKLVHSRLQRARDNFILCAGSKAYEMGYVNHKDATHITCTIHPQPEYASRSTAFRMV